MVMPKLTIVVSGMIAGDTHQGGASWAVLQYLLGFRRLGHEVYFVEPLRPEVLEAASAPLETSGNAAYFREVTGAFGLEGRAALLVAGSQETVGVDYRDIVQIGRRADVLVNISGLLADEELIGDIPVRVFLDLDPAFTQLWHAVEGIDMGFDRHTHFVTVGLSVGRPECSVPTSGLPWITTLQPVVLGCWPAGGKISHDALTTVGNWRGYGSIQHDGVFYGQKAHSLRELMDLPTLTTEPFLLALAIHPDERRDLSALAAHGWTLVDPPRVAGTPATYRRFLQRSKAEFGIAKSGYVVSRCGWFSDRSVCYLASGRPVIAQDTGFSRFLPTGEGLFAFETSDDVLGAIETLRDDYPRQARVARSIAREHFDSDRVLRRLLNHVEVVS
jgi:hypothetical protein